MRPAPTSSRSPDGGHAPGPDLVRALSTLQFPDSLGIRLDSSRIGDAAFVMNLVTPDNGESFVVPMVNRSLTGAAPRGPDPNTDTRVDRDHQ